MESKMKVTGIIMECNPFHEGHEYLLREARRQTGADYIVAAMSGDYVQRGEPAVFDKYIRAGQILQAGADLVLELPLYAACGSAEYFARSGIALLDRLGVVTDLCFGSESGDTDYIMKCARVLTLAEGGEASSVLGKMQHSPSSDNNALYPSEIRQDPSGLNNTAVHSSEKNTVPSLSENSCQNDSKGQDYSRLYRDKLQIFLRSGMPFPAARAAALQASFGECGSNTGLGADSFSDYPSSPNDLLAVEYCRALLSAGSFIQPHAISRIPVPSATDRRTQLSQDRAQGLFSTGVIPENKNLLPGHSLVKDVPLFPLTADDFSFHLLYALKMTGNDAESFSDISGDLAERIRRMMYQFTGYTQFRGLLKTRNMTLTRISRCLLHLLLGIKKERMSRLQALGMALYARPLAINRAAGPLLSEIKKNSTIPFIPKLSAASSILSEELMEFLTEEIRAEELYTMTLSAVAAGECNLPAASPPALKRPIVFLRK